MPEIPTPKSLEGLSTAEKRMLLAQLLQKRAERGSVSPMSEGQKGLWMLHQMEPHNPAYNMSFPSRVRSRLDVPAFRQALQTLVQRHPALRSTFAEQDGELVQRVHDSMTVEVPQVDAAHWTDAQLQDQLQAQISEPFDLAHGPLLRTCLFTRAPDDQVFLAVAHHIALDFWSLIVLLTELREIYPAVCAGRTPRLPPPKSNYSDFVKWQQEMLASAQGEQLAGYWENQLAGVPHVLEVPTDLPRPPQFSHRAAVVPCQISQELTSRLLELAAQEQVTLYSVLLAAFQLLLCRHSGQSDFVVGTPFVGRSRPGFEDTVGYFVNMLPIRAALTNELTFRRLLRQVGATALDALEHQDYPFALIVERLRVARDASRPPLVQVSFTLERAQRQEEAGRARFLFPNAETHLNVGGLLGETYFVEPRTCRHELELVLEHSGGTINGLLCYCTDLFHQGMMERMVEHFRLLLHSAVAQPDLPLSQLVWFSEAERTQVINEWNQTAAGLSRDPCLHQLFEQQVARTPDAVAIRAGDRSISYRELDTWANRLARQLVVRGVQRGTFVPLGLERSPEQLALILATLKAGGVCVPLDPHAPPERLQAVLADIGSALVIGQAENAALLRTATGAAVVTQDELWGEADAGPDPGAPGSGVQSGDLAYVVYTSGSTGTPRGVMVEHRAIGNTIQWRKQALPVSTSDRVLLLLPCFFDAWFSVTFSTLTQGGSLVVVSPGGELNPNALLELAARERLTVLPAPPRLLQVLVDHPLIKQCLALRQVQTGGESLSPELCRQVVDQLHVPLVNLYGPTEAAVETTYWICQPGERTTKIPIGRPIANVRTYVLGADQQPVPVGVPGELYIGGAGLARGYLHDSGRTAERFLPDPFSAQGGARLYRTGDSCRWLADGNLEFLGRLDQQVKLRGYRIELAEIEHALAAHPAVREAAVAMQQSPSQEPQLVAYVVFRENGEQLTEDQLRRELLQKLPAYMVPTLFETLEKLPRTPGGKLDRRALPHPRQRSRDHRPYVAPRTPLEQYLVDACQKILKIADVGMRDSFYALGGTSIQGALLLAALQDELGQRVQTATLFNLTEIGELADYLAENHAEAVAVRFGAESAARSPEKATGSNEPAAPTRARAADGPGDLIVPLQPKGHGIPLFMVHPPGGIVICYQPLAHRLGDGQPLYAIRARGLHGESELPADLVSMAAEYVAAIRTVAPRGPYCLGGWSLGGVIAYEVAQQLVRAQEAVPLLLLLDTTIPQGAANEQYLVDEPQIGLEYGLDLTLEQLAELAPEQQLRFLWEHARKLGVLEEGAPESLVQQVLDDLGRLFHHHLKLAGEYAIAPYPGRITLVRPREAPVEVATVPDRGWGQLAAAVDVHFVPGQHHSMVKEPHVAMLARFVADGLAQAGRPG